MARSKSNITVRISELGLNESLAFPIIKLSSVRSAASAIGLANNRLYRTETDRISQTITVTRLK